MDLVHHLEINRPGSGVGKHTSELWNFTAHSPRQQHFHAIYINIVLAHEQHSLRAKLMVVYMQGS